MEIFAPRPLRHPFIVHRPRPTGPLRIVSAPLEAFARISLTDDTDDYHPSSTTSTADEPSPSIASSLLLDNTSPSSSIESTPASTRLSLPQEALEEFLSISLKRPARRQAVGSSSSLPLSYERPHPYKSRKSGSSGSSAEDDDRRSRRGVGRRSHRTSDGEPRAASPLLEEEAEWRNFALGSPISRNQTRNPLPRHPSYETLSSNLLFYSSLPPAPLLFTTSPVMNSPVHDDVDEPHSSNLDC